MGLGGPLWTSKKVHVFLRAHFGVRFSHGGLIRLLRRLGLSFQRPDRRARQADPDAVDAWTSTEYPAIRAQAAAEDALVSFADQVGARSDHLSGRTWGRRGETPTLARTGNRFGVNAISAIWTTGQMSFTVLPGCFDAATCTEGAVTGTIEIERGNTGDAEPRPGTSTHRLADTTVHITGNGSRELDPTADSPTPTSILAGIHNRQSEACNDPDGATLDHNSGTDVT